MQKAKPLGVQGEYGHNLRAPNPSVSKLERKPLDVVVQTACYLGLHIML